MSTIKTIKFHPQSYGEGIARELVANHRNQVYQVNYPYDVMNPNPSLDCVPCWCVYLCRSLYGVVYVGMTKTFYKRIMHHRSAHTPLGEWLREGNPHGWLIVGDGLSQDMARVHEARTILHLLDTGHPLLNKDMAVPLQPYPRRLSAFERRLV